jgi:ubiquinone/menaquinone biosynthesis C-methylase UbiE
MRFPLWYVFRHQWREFADFKPTGFELSGAEFSDVYSRTARWQSLQGLTDLNDESVDAILANVVGDSVIDVGCGRGYLARRLTSVASAVTGCDIVLADDLTDTSVTWTQGSVENLPFEDRQFDTVVCTHTLEHVQSIHLAISELRRIAKKRLIVVVPKERPYRYVFNLYLHFFPYRWNLYSIFGVVPGARLDDLGDWFYVEDTARTD